MTIKPPPSGERNPGDTIALAAQTLARARISDIASIIEAWPRCHDCHHAFSPIQIIRKQKAGQVYGRCPQCQSREAKRLYHERMRVRERLAAALEPSVAIAAPASVPTRATYHPRRGAWDL